MVRTCTTTAARVSDTLHTAESLSAAQCALAAVVAQDASGHCNSGHCKTAGTHASPAALTGLRGFGRIGWSVGEQEEGRSSRKLPSCVLLAPCKALLGRLPCMAGRPRARGRGCRRGAAARCREMPHRHAPTRCKQGLQLNIQAVTAGVVCACDAHSHARGARGLARARPGLDSQPASAPPACSRRSCPRQVRPRSGLFA